MVELAPVSAAEIVSCCSFSEGHSEYLSEINTHTLITVITWVGIFLTRVLAVCLSVHCKKDKHVRHDRNATGGDYIDKLKLINATDLWLLLLRLAI